MMGLLRENLVIENPRGTFRHGTDKHGIPWSKLMTADYGFLKKTKGADGEGVDVYIGDHPDIALEVYVVHQLDAETGKFDEDKVMIGFSSFDEARNAFIYHANDPRRCGPITVIPSDQFFESMSDGRVAVKSKKKLVTGLDFSFQENELASALAAISNASASLLFFWSEEDERLHPRGKPDNAGKFREKNEAERGRLMKEAKTRYPSQPVEGKTQVRPVPNTLSRAPVRKDIPGKDITEDEAYDRAAPFYKSLAERAEKYKQMTAEELIQDDDLWDVLEQTRQGADITAGKYSYYYKVPEDPVGSFFDHPTYGRMVKLDWNNPPDWFKTLRQGGFIKITPDFGNVYIPHDIANSEIFLRYTRRGQNGELKSKAVYKPEIEAARQIEKWTAVSKLEENMDGIISNIQKEIDTNDNAAATLLMARTGLRVGSDPKTGAIGVVKMKREHLSFDQDGNVLVQFTGKSKKGNYRRITSDPAFSMGRLVDETEPLRKKLAKGQQLTPEEKQLADTAMQGAIAIATSGYVYSPSLHKLLSKKMKTVQPGQPLFNSNYQAVGQYIKEKAQYYDKKISPHKFRNSYGSTAFLALRDIYMAGNRPPENEDELKLLLIGKTPPAVRKGAKKKMTIHPDYPGLYRLAGLMINDTWSAYAGSYLNPVHVQQLKEIAGVSWDSTTPPVDQRPNLSIPKPIQQRLGGTPPPSHKAKAPKVGSEPEPEPEPDMPESENDSDENTES